MFPYYTQSTLILVLLLHPKWMDETNAFVIPKVSRRTSSTQLAQAPRFDKEGHHIAMNVVSTGGIVDHERAQYCADNFGACSVEEVEAMKHELHQERLQNLMVGGGGYGSLAFSVDGGTTVEDRLLEEELDLQLQLLKEHQASPDVSLFPVDPVEDQALPHLHDSNDATEENTNAEHDKGFFHKPTPEEIFVLEETVMEENLLEPIAMCLAIVGLALLPQFL